MTKKENIIQKIAQKMPGGTMRGDATAFAVVSVILLGVICVTAVVFLAYQQTEPILTNIMQGFGVPASQIAVQTGLGGNLYTFDTWIPLIGYFIFLSICLSTIFLDADPLSWLVGILFIPINFYIASWISNIGQDILTQAILTNGVHELPQSISLLANLQTIVLLFSVLYIVCLAVRIWFFNPSGKSSGNQKLV